MSMCLTVAFKVLIEKKWRIIKLSCKTWSRLLTRVFFSIGLWKNCGFEWVVAYGRWFHMEARLYNIWIQYGTDHAFTMVNRGFFRHFY